MSPAQAGFSGATQSPDDPAYPGPPKLTQKVSQSLSLPGKERQFSVTNTLAGREVESQARPGACGRRLLWARSDAGGQRADRAHSHGAGEQGGQRGVEGDN